MFVIDDAASRAYVITWNLQSNREHSIYETTYAADVFPENLIMKGLSFSK